MGARRPGRARLADVYCLRRTPQDRRRLPAPRAERSYLAANRAGERSLAAAGEARPVELRESQAVLCAGGANHAPDPGRPRAQHPIEKRGGGAPKASIEEAVALGTTGPEEFLVLDQALTQLADFSPRKAQIIEMRYFGGLNVEEMAGVLGVSIATISREQKTAEAWLSQAMSAES